MRCRWWFPLVMLARPLAAADGVSDPAALPVRGAAPGIERTTPTPAFDPRLDHGYLRSLPAPRPAPPAIERDGPRGREQPADPWSLRVKIEPGGVDTRRWLDQGAESPGLADEIGRLMEQSTFGLVGTYRF